MRLIGWRAARPVSLIASDAWPLLWNAIRETDSQAAASVGHVQRRIPTRPNLDKNDKMAELLGRRMNWLAIVN